MLKKVRDMNLQFVALSIPMQKVQELVQLFIFQNTKSSDANIRWHLIKLS